MKFYPLGFVRESCKCHVLTFDSVDETLRCNHSARQMKEVAPVLSHGVFVFQHYTKIDFFFTAFLCEHSLTESEYLS